MHSFDNVVYFLLCNLLLQMAAQHNKKNTQVLEYCEDEAEDKETEWRFNIALEKNRSTFISWKLLHRSQPNFAQQ